MPNKTTPAGASTGTTSMPTLYDETFRARNHNGEFSVATMGNQANLIGFLEHHSEDTDGSFAICVAGLTGVLVSKAVWESIPEEHRPPLNPKDKTSIPYVLFGTEMETIGSVIFPLLLIDMATQQRFRIKLYALVVPQLLMGMLISQNAPFCLKQLWGGRKGHRGPVFTFKFNDKTVEVEGC